MPITKLIVGGFKSIAQTIEIPLAPITLLFGPNSAGKSTIKDAMLALKASMTQPDDAEFRAGRLARMLLAFADRKGDGHILSEADEDGEALRMEVTLGCLVEPFGEHGSTTPRLQGWLGELAVDLSSQLWSGAVEYVVTERFGGARSSVHLSFDNHSLIRYVSGIQLQQELQSGSAIRELKLAPRFEHSSSPPGWLQVDLSDLMKRVDFQELVEPLIKLGADSDQSDPYGIWWVDGDYLNIRCDYADRQLKCLEEFFYLAPGGSNLSLEASGLIQNILNVLTEMLFQVEWGLARDIDIALVSGSRVGLTREDVTTEELPPRLPTRSIFNSAPQASDGTILRYAEWLGLKTAKPDALSASDLEALNREDDFVNRVLSKDLFVGRRYQVKPEVTEHITRLLVGQNVDFDDEATHALQTTLYLQDQHGRNLDFDQVGSGVSFVLPVLTALWGASRSWIEQPELHLHPAAQCEMGDAVVMAFNRGRFSVIETHSEHMLLRILKRIRQTSTGQVNDPELRCQPEAVAVLFFEPKEDGTTEVHQLRITRGGDFMDRWPRGFFDERNAELFDE